MKKLKLYKIVYIDYSNNKNIIDLTELLDRLNIDKIVTKWAIEYDFESLIKHQIFNKQQFKYDYRIVYINEGEVIPELYFLDKKTVISNIDWLHRLQQIEINKLNELEFINLFQKYGNTYSNKKGGL